MVQKSVVLQKKAGLHARSISQLVQVASRYHCKIFLTYSGKKVNVKSIMGVLSLGIPSHAEVTVVAEGQDQIEALNEVMKQLISLD